MTLAELKDEVIDFIELNKIENINSDILYHFVLEHRLRAVQEYQMAPMNRMLDRAKNLTKEITEHNAKQS